MTKIIALGLTLILLIPLLAAGCAGSEATDTTSTTTSSGENTITITLDEFSTHTHVIKFIEMDQLSTLEVRLGSNPTTGYDWGDAAFDPPGIVSQISRNYEEPADTGLVGAGGTEVWVFKAMDIGLTVIQIGYSRSWETGQESLYSLTINVRVK